MKTDALMIFVKNPEPGKVKTRIARDAGNQVAVRVYTKLLAHTHHIVAGLPADKYVFYNDYITAGDRWSEPAFRKKLQHGLHLGERMQHAFAGMFAAGYQRVVIIGSDCYELTSSMVDSAFAQLIEKDLVIGPAHDGGYYLLGLSTPCPSLFQNKSWSTAAVFAQTMADADLHGLTTFLLPTLHDVDTVHDCHRYPGLLD